MRVSVFSGLWAVGIFFVPVVCRGEVTFNTNRKELASLSRTAGAELQGALANIHLMLQFLEQGKPEEAQKSRLDATKTLTAAIKDFAQIADRAPQQPLIIKPQSELAARAIESLTQVLKTRNIPFPKTERELGQLAIRLVADLQNALDAGQRFGPNNKRDRTYFEKLFREEGDLLNIGLFCSVIWDQQESAR